MHNFRSSLSKGKAGEAALNKLWPELVPTDGRKGDFLLDGALLEVKSDMYDANKTENFFIERYSNSNKLSPGSVWQALEHGCKYFVYFFPMNKVAYVFDTEQLKTELEKIINTLKPINIPNKGYDTIGFKVPRKALNHIVKEVKQW